MKTRLSLLCVALLTAGPVLAQMATPAAPPVERLPADTWMVVTWHGTSPVNKVRATNPLVRLWNDPGAQGLRDRFARWLADQIRTEQAKSETPTTDPEEVIARMQSLAENPLVLGFASSFPPVPTNPGETPLFVVYVKTGKADLIEKWRKEIEAREGPETETSTFTFRGVEVKKTVKTTQPEPEEPLDFQEGQEPKEQEPQDEPPPKIDVTYIADVGDYALFAQSREVMEALIERFQAQALPTVSLANDKVYQTAKNYRTEGTLLEMFVKIPDLTQIPIPPTEQFDVAAMMRELHMERLQGLAMSSGLTTDKTLLRVAVLGDTAAGSLFDLVGADAAEFRTAAITPVTASFAAFRMDLPALYATLRRAVQAGLPPQQAAMADMVDGMVAMQTGMPLPELLKLFPGEVGTMTTGEAQMAEVLPDTVAIAISGSEPVVGLLRTTLGPMITGEEPVSGATLLTLQPPPSGAEGEQPEGSKPYYVAVAPTMVLVSQSKQQVTDALERLASGVAAPPGSMAADPGFQRARKALPELLSGLSYADFSRISWEKQRELMRKQFAKQKQEMLEKADAAMKGDEENPPDPEEAERLRKSAAEMDEIADLVDAVFPLLQRYLKSSVGAWRKAADGLFMESILN